MAKAKKTKTDKPKREKVKAAEVSQQITPRKLSALMATARSSYKDMREIAGGLGAEIKNAAEHDHLNKKAFAIVRGLDRLEPEKLADTLDSLDYYLDVSGLRKRASQVQRLPMDPDAGDADTEEKRTGNVQAFPMPHGQAAE